MLSVLSAIFPVFAVIATGYGLSRFFIADDAFWSKLDRLIYYVLLPCILIKVIAEAHLSWEIVTPGAAIVLTVTTLAAISFFSRKIFGKTSAQFTSVFQGAVRVNFYIPLSLVAILYGAEMLEKLSLLLIFLLITSAPYSVIIMEKYGDKGEGHDPSAPVPAKKIMRALAKNPIMISTFIGLALNMLIGDTMPAAITETLSLFSRASLPLALIGIGAKLSFKHLMDNLPPVLEATALRLIVGPLLVTLLSIPLGLTHDEFIAVMMVMSVPSAASSISFAINMGGDERLMASILSTQIILSLFTLTVIISLL